MTGVKECINWMIDNQPRKLCSKDSDYTIWFEHSRFRSQFSGCDEIGHIKVFKTLGQYDWQEKEVDTK